MNADERKLIRAVIRRVHPDLFSAHPYERQKNSEALKVLNSYIDTLSKGEVPSSSRLEFYVKDGQYLNRIEAYLPSHGSLAPLFFAFELISEEELKEGTLGSGILGDTNILEWLRDTVQEAVRIAEQHDSLKQRVRELRASIEYKFGLASLKVGPEFSARVNEQQQQIESLKVLDACFTALSQEGWNFKELNIHVYHPEQCPLGTYTYVDPDGTFNVKTTRMRSYIADDGCIHIVADRASIKTMLRNLDLEQARILTRVTMFWLKRVRDLTPVLKSVLGVDNVWCDTRTEANSQNFVLWAGYLLERRQDVQQLLGRKRFAFSLLVHSDVNSPLIDFSNSSSMLQVRSDCPLQKLLDFLTSDSGIAANEAAAAVHTTKKEEQVLLEEIRTAFGAKHVVRVCSMYEQEKVLSGARRLLENAEVIKEAVDLRGASIALDDCYEIWGSGFISIPYDFKLQELPKKLVKLLNSDTQMANGNGNEKKFSKLSPSIKRQVENTTSRSQSSQPIKACLSRLTANISRVHHQRASVPSLVRPSLQHLRSFRVSL